MLFGVPLKEVKEVLSLPKDIIPTPSNSAIKGVFLLRGELITVLDTAFLLGVQSLEVDEPKVMIFKLDNKLIGLEVNSIEAISVIFNADKIGLKPQILMGDKAPHFIYEVLSHKEIKSLMLVDTKDLFSSVLDLV